MKDPCFPGTFPPIPLSQSTTIVSAFLTVFITTGNSLVIIAIVKDPRKQLRSPFAYFLANLALSDLIVGVIAMPVSVMFHIMEARRDINMISIYIVHTTFFLSLAASLFSMAAMCFDRYFTIVSLTVKERRFTRCRCTKLSAAIWVLSIAFTGLYFLAGYITLVTIYLNVSFICIFGITLLTYVKILRSLKAISKVIKRNPRDNSAADSANSKEQRCKTAKCKRSKMKHKSKTRNAVVVSSLQEREGQQSNETKPKPSQCIQNRRLATEQRITRVFLAMLTTFLSSNLPAIAFTYVLQFCFSCSCDLRHVFRDIVFLLLPTASGLNALICILKLPSIRRAVREILQLKRKQFYEFNSTDVGKIWRNPSPRQWYTERYSNLERSAWDCMQNQTTYGLNNDACQHSIGNNTFKYEHESDIGLEGLKHTVDKMRDHETIALERIRTPNTTEQTK